MRECGLFTDKRRLLTNMKINLREKREKEREA
jgi:hypothetical protein